jgi:putative flippase GtrA
MSHALVRYSAVRRGISRFVAFALVGGVGTAIQYAVLSFGVALNMAHPVSCSAVGYALGAVANYLLNYRFTFRSKAPHAQAATKYFTVLAVGWVLNLCLMSIFVVRMGWSPWMSQMLTTVIGLVWNYSGSNWWAYRASDNTSKNATIAEPSQINDRVPTPILNKQGAHQLGVNVHAPLVIQ